MVNRGSAVESLTSGRLQVASIISATRRLAAVRPTRHDWFFAVFVATLVAATSAELTSMVRWSRQDGTASHLPLIPVVSFGLLLLERSAVFRASRFAVPSGSIVILLGVGIRTWAERTLAVQDPNLLTAQMLAIVVTAIGGFIACYGPLVARAALFPLAFLLFMIPIPPRLLEWVIEILKVGSTEVVDGLFALTRTTYHRDGFVFSLPRLMIEVADECSGIRSSIALLLTSLLAGYMFLKSGWKRALLVTVVVPITIVKNGIRIVGLSLLSIHVNPGFIEGRLHHEGGIVFFLLALGLFAPVLGLLRRSERPLAA